MPAFRKVLRHAAMGVLVALSTIPAATISASAASTLKTIYTFKGSPHDGRIPINGLVRDKSGVYYGVTSTGGKDNSGTIFQLTPPATASGKWTEKVIFNFSKTSGTIPYDDIIIDKAGALYGTAGYDGPGGWGTVFKLSPPAAAGKAWTVKVLHAFQDDMLGFEPHGKLLMDASGVLYGTTYKGGNGTPDGGASPCPFGCGVVFKLIPGAPGGGYDYSILYTFNHTDGAHPYRGVVMDKAGALYGTTVNGGSNNCFNGGEYYGCGLVFKLKPPVAPKTKWTEQILYRFADNSGGGSIPSELLLDDNDGSLYGTAPTSGAGKHGLIYQLSPKTGGATYKLRLLHTFTAGSEISALTPDGKGGFYGTNRGDGATGDGAFFKLGPAKASGARAYTLMYSFAVADKKPLSDPALEPNGKLLGYTQSGGAPLDGTIYELTP